MEQWATAGTLDDLWDGEMRQVTVGGVDLVLCNAGGHVFAFADRCPHLAGRLSEGRFDGRYLTCGNHEWVFDARGGQGLNPSNVCLTRYPARVDGEIILVDMGSGAG